MTSIRPYRTLLGDQAAQTAIAELRSGIGTRYWSNGVEAFVNLFETGKLDYRMYYFNDRVPVPEFAAARQREFDDIRDCYQSE